MTALIAILALIGAAVVLRAGAEFAEALGIWWRKL